MMIRTLFIGAALAFVTLSAQAETPRYDGPLKETLSLQHYIKPEGDLPPIEPCVSNPESSGA